jgi:DNA (cytosine-5)-methyltransferase 1
MKPTVLDLFSGCGGFSHGFIQAGFEVVGFVEYWKPAIKTYKLNHPNSKHIGTDITKISDETIKEYENKIDVIIGGPPCQGFSMAGKRDNSDPRNQLYKHYLRFVRLIKPKLIVMENVKGILSMKDNFGEKVINNIILDLIKLEYHVSYKVFNAKNYGIAQNRERVIITAKKLDLSPETNNESKAVIEAIQNIPKNYNAHEFIGVTEEVMKRIEVLEFGGKLSAKYNFSRQRLFPDKHSPTIPTKSMFIHPFEHRLLTPRELARLQSFPDDFLFKGSKTSMIKQIGNAVPPKMASEIGNKIIKNLN